MKTNSNSLSNLTSPIGIIFQLADRTIQSCSPDAERILGYTAEQLIGSSCDPFWQAIREDGSSFTPETHPAIAPIETGQPQRDVVMGVYRSNGDLVWLSVSTVPLFRVKENKAYGIEVTFTAITAQTAGLGSRRQTNLQDLSLIDARSILQSAIANTAEIAFVKNLAGKYVIVNQAAAGFLGKRVEQILGRDDTALFAPEIARSIMMMDRQIISEGMPLSYEEEIPNSTANRCLLTSKYPWRDDSGNICGVIGICKDVTALKRSQQKLQENERLLRLALSSSNTGSWDWKIATGEITWSPENYEIYGLDTQVESLEYRDWEDRLHPEDRLPVSQEVQQVISGRLPKFDREFRIVHPQRGVRWIWGVANPTYSDRHEVVRLSGINIDVTERRNVTEKIRRSEQHLRRVIDSLFTFVAVLNPDGTLLEVNRPALEVANLQLEDVLDRPFAETYWWSFSDESKAKLNDSIKRAAAGATVRHDVEARIGADSYFLVDFCLVPLFDAEGRVEYLIASGIDITERARSQEAVAQREYELKLITEVIPQQVWTALPNGQLDYINKRWQNYTGVNLQQLQENGWSSIVHPEDLKRVSRAWNKSIESGKNHNVEARLRHKNGTYHWFICKARPLRDRRGEIVKWYGTNTNINRIKELEEKLRKQTEDLIEANRLKDDFLAIVSHELRTPLNPILGWSQLLATGKLDPEKTATGIEIINRNAKLQSQIIDDLLDVSRILRGKLDLKTAPLNLESVIRSALTTVQLAAEAKSIQVETVFEPNVGEVLGNAERLQQVVWNLVSNAIKFTPEQGRVVVTLNRVDNYALIQVRDTGRGIEPDFLPYVFERFRQAQSSTTREFGGLGLGLAIVRHLVELHGGTVTVESPGSDRGAIFSVRLPLINAPTTEQSAPEPVESVNPQRFDGLQILIVDDDIDSLDILTLVLQQEGAEVVAVASAREALAAFERSTLDLMISDIGMPEVDGYTLLAQIRQLPRGQNLPAIALSAYAGNINRQRSLDAGYQEHLAKPIEIDKLISTVTSVRDQNSEQ